MNSSSRVTALSGFRALRAKRAVRKTAIYWTNFAKYGDPNGQGLPQWPAFSDANPVVMNFAQTPQAGTVPSADSLKVLDAYFAWRRTPEGAAAVK